MYTLLNKEAEIYHILHSNITDTNDISLNTIKKNIDDTIKLIIPVFGFWLNKIIIDISLENKDNLSEYKKLSYKNPHIKIYYNTIVKCVDRFTIPSDMVVNNALCYALCQALIEWDIKEKKDLLEVIDKDIYCEQFAYNICCRDFFIESDMKELINNINSKTTNEDLGHLPLIWYPDGINMPKETDSVGAIFGRQGDNKTKDTTDYDNMVVSQDDDGNFYSEDEIYDIIQQYKIWCTKNNKTPMDTDKIAGKYITHIKNLIAD